MANLPLISAVSVTVEPLDTGSTEYHGRAREPVKGVARSASVTFDAQHSQSRRKGQTPREEGDAPETSGYLCTRQWMLDAISYDPKSGDKITAIGSRTVALYVTSLEDSAHLDGANTLVLIYYSSQRPRRA